MAASNHIQNVAIIGATGSIGQYFVEHLLKTGKHTVTAITREESQSTPPAGVKVARVNYDDNGSSLVAALQGQQFLIMTLPSSDYSDSHNRIIKSAVQAGVKYIMPNGYGYDIYAENAHSARILGNCKEIESLGASYITMVCGFWYEFSLALGEPWFGFDIASRKAVFFDDGKKAIDVSTWSQCGRALAALLSLPESGASPSLSQWKNSALYIRSFRVCQRDMLDSLNRVLGTSDKDWEISYEKSEQREKDGLQAMKDGDHRGMVKSMYARVFASDSVGQFVTAERGANEALKLPKDDIDEATKKAVEMVKGDWVSKRLAAPFVNRPKKAE